MDEITRIRSYFNKLVLPDYINEFNLDEIYYTISKKIDLFERRIFPILSSTIENESPLNTAQEGIWKTIHTSIQNKDYLNSYIKIIDYCTSECSYSKIELDNINIYLSQINSYIKQKYDLDEIYNKLVKKINIDSDIEFEIFKTGPNLKRRISLANNELKIKWDKLEKTVCDEITIKELKKVLIENKEQLLSFSKKQQKAIKEILITGYSDDCKGKFDLIEYYVANRYRDENLKLFYSSFQSRIYETIEKYIKD